MISIKSLPHFLLWNAILVLPVALAGQSNVVSHTFAGASEITKPFVLYPTPNGTTTGITFSPDDPNAGIRISDADPKSGIGIALWIKVEPGHLYRQTATLKGGPLMFYFKWQDADKKYLAPEKASTFPGSQDFKKFEYAERAPDQARWCQLWIYSASTMITEVVLRDFRTDDLGRAVDSSPGMTPTTAESVLKTFNLDYPGLEKAKAALEKKDFNLGLKEILIYYRGRTHIIHTKLDRSKKKETLITEKEQRWADQALSHIFPAQPAYPSSDRGADIDWATNPTKDPEWIWQLHRMYWWPALGKAYWSSGDERYAREWCQELADWVKKNPLDHSHAYAWRTIETGQRCVTLTGSFEAFVDSAAFTPDILVQMIKTVHDHAGHLLKNKGSKNWLLFESEGLMYLGVYFPELSEARAWRQEAIKRFNTEIENQVFADGVHNELSPSYHIGVIDTFYSAFRIAALNGMAGEFPKTYSATIEKMILAVMKISLPDLTLPQFGDSWKGRSLTNFFRTWNGEFPREELAWFAGERQNGKAPAETAFALSQAGFYSVRSDWSSNAVCMVLKSGADGGFHCQEDNNTFEFFALGRHFMPDSGSFIYSGDPEGRSWFRKSSVHQTLTLNDANIRYQPKLRLWQPGRESDALIVENANYSNLTHRRAVYFVRKKFLVLVDDAIGTADGDLRLHFQLLPSTMRLDEKNLSVQTDFPEGANLLIQSAAGAGISLTPEEGFVSFIYTKKEPRPAFAYRIQKDSKTGFCRFVTVILPYEGIAPKVGLVHPGPGKSPDEGYTLRVTLPNDSVTIHYNPKSNQAVIQ